MRRTVLALALLAFPASAQIESALLSKVTFNLTNPGGKSLAMGGAFTAIADDATAAVANPAGLGLLSGFETAISLKRADDVLELVTARSTATGALTAAYPAVRGVNSDLRDTRSEVEFASVVVPVSSRLVGAVSYAENLRFHGDAGPEGYSYVELRDNRSGGTTRRDFLYEYREYGAVSLTSKQLVLSLGYRLSERVRLGAGLSLSRTTFDLEGDAGGPHRVVNRVFTSPLSVEVKQTTLEVRDFGGTEPGILLGVHADLLADGALTGGLAFRASRRSSGTLVLGGDVPTVLASKRERELSFGVPKDAAAGLAWHPLPGLTLAAEAQWIDYGDTAREALPVETYRGFAGPSPGVFVENLLAEPQAPGSVVVPRLGLEYVSGGSRVRVAVRAGYHREPAHGVTSRLVARDGAGTPYPVTDPPFSAAVETVYDGGRADDRFSGGVGLTLDRRLSLDVAFDVGRASRQLAASVFYRF